MKRFLLLTLLVLFVPVSIFAIEWTTANQCTIQWNAVTYDLSQNERISYVTYLANAITDPSKANPSEIGTTQTTSFTFTIGVKGSYYAGVKSVVEILEGGTWKAANQSAISWSDSVDATNQAPFGVRFYPIPPAPIGLRPAQ